MIVFPLNPTPGQVFAQWHWDGEKWVSNQIGVFTQVMNGLVPASGPVSTNFLRADGHWVAAPGAGGPAGNLIVGSTTVQGGVPGNILFDNSGVLGARAEGGIVGTQNIDVTAFGQSFSVTNQVVLLTCIPVSGPITLTLPAATAGQTIFIKVIGANTPSDHVSSATANIIALGAAGTAPSTGPIINAGGSSASLVYDGTDWQLLAQM